MLKLRYLKKDEEAKITASNPQIENEKKLDLSFKEGQTIKINIGVRYHNSTLYFHPLVI